MSEFTSSVQLWLAILEANIRRELDRMMAADANHGTTVGDFIAMYDNPVVDGLTVAGVELRHNPMAPPGKVILMRRELPLPPIQPVFEPANHRFDASLYALFRYRPIK